MSRCAWCPNALVVMLVLSLGATVLISLSKCLYFSLERRGASVLRLYTYIYVHIKDAFQLLVSALERLRSQ